MRNFWPDLRSNKNNRLVAGGSAIPAMTELTVFAQMHKGKHTCPGLLFYNSDDSSRSSSIDTPISPVRFLSVQQLVETALGSAWRESPSTA
ncbi:hypothetical protein TNCV_2261131 [Trichonephila clavipes]|nr:hypothetical protein TNCV_2261131 [Trichonephila clavipes]